MDTASFIVLVVATVAAGLIAGLFYAYACSVMPGLARGSAETFVEGLRGINVAIVNGWFLLTFLGAPVLAAAAGILRLGASTPLWWTVAGFVFLVATIVITRAVHIPMNDALAASRDSAQRLRDRFEARWVRWNVARTGTSIAGFGCLVGALAS